jgi:hypothetical protein
MRSICSWIEYSQYIVDMFIAQQAWSQQLGGLPVRRMACDGPAAWDPRNNTQPALSRRPNRVNIHLFKDQKLQVTLRPRFCNSERSMHDDQTAAIIVNGREA